MAQCKWCDKTGIFLKVSKEGLCKACEIIINADAQSRLRAMKNCDKIIERTKKIDIAINNYTIIIEYLKYFLPHEEKGINVFNVKTSEFIADIYNDKNDKILELLIDEKKRVLEKINKAKTDKTIANYKNNFIEKVCGIEQYFEPSARNYSQVKVSLHELKSF